jgi:CheY-like chemotaxis protein
MRILVIDDEEMIRTLAVKILEKEGHAVLTAESGQIGIELLERNPEMIDVVLVDNTMPGMTGIETIRQVQRTARALPCILSSGNLLECCQLPDYLRTCTSLLQKPYRPQNLVEKVLDVHRSAVRSAS